MPNQKHGPSFMGLALLGAAVAVVVGILLLSRYSGDASPASASPNAAPPFWSRMTAPKSARPGQPVVYHVSVRNYTDVGQPVNVAVSSHNIRWGRPPRLGGNFLGTNFPLGKPLKGIPSLTFAPSRIVIAAHNRRRFYFAFASTSPKLICLHLSFSARVFGPFGVSRCTKIS